MTTMNDVVALLLGEGELDGFWFGEKHERKRGSFWWREYLREAYSAHLAKGAQVRDGRPPQAWVEAAYKRFLEINGGDSPKAQTDLGTWTIGISAAMLSQRGEVQS